MEVSLYLRNEMWKRVLHMTHLISTIVLYYTGASWYFPSLAGFIGGYNNVMLAHRVAAAVFILVPLYMLFTQWKKVGKFIGDLIHWTKEDNRWMLKFPAYILNYEKTKMPNYEGKFNPGQKFSGSIQVGLCLLIGVTGIFWMALPRLLPDTPKILLDLVSTAHLFSVLVLLVFLMGHIYLGSGLFRPYRGMLRTMFGDGLIDKEKARKIWPQWAEEMEQQDYSANKEGLVSQQPTKPAAK